MGRRGRGIDRQSSEAIRATEREKSIRRSYHKCFKLQPEYRRLYGSTDLPANDGPNKWGPATSSGIRATTRGGRGNSNRVRREYENYGLRKNAKPPKQPLDQPSVEGLGAEVQIVKAQQKKETRLARNKILSQKTRKGQPLMKPRIEELLATIEKGKH